jgi:hypothetical protein
VQVHAANARGEAVTKASRLRADLQAEREARFSRRRG